MKIEEIYRTSSRDEDLTKFLPRFKNAVEVGEIKKFLLYKKTDQDDIFYGLFDQNKNLVSVLWLTKYDNVKYQSVTIQVINSLRRQKLAASLYINSLLNDNLVILSDTRHTPESEALWDYLKRIKTIKVLPYDLKSNKIVKTTKKSVYANNEHLVWIAFKNIKANNK